MDSNNRPKMLRGMGSYISGSFKFYELKSEYTAPLVFILILVVYFFSSYLFTPNMQNIDLTRPESIAELSKVLSRVLFASFFSNIIINLISSIYLGAYISELKGQTYPIRKIPGINIKNLAGIAAAHVITYAIIPIAAYLIKFDSLAIYVSVIFSLLVIPFVIVYIIILFNNCFILDKNKSIISAFKLSAALTKGHRMEIFSIILILKFITTMLTLLATSFVASSESGLVQLFVVSFVSAVFSLMETRIVALMYVDLEYGRNTGI